MSYFGSGPPPTQQQQLMRPPTGQASAGIQSQLFTQLQQQFNNQQLMEPNFPGNTGSEHHHHAAHHGMGNPLLQMQQQQQAPASQPNYGNLNYIADQLISQAAVAAATGQNPGGMLNSMGMQQTTSPLGFNNATSGGTSSSNTQQQTSSKQRVFTGTVTKTHDNFGFIDEEVFFQMSVVKGVVLPKAGDRVLVEADYNPNMPFKWNATRVQIVNIGTPVTPPTSKPIAATPPPRYSIPTPPIISASGGNRNQQAADAYIHTSQYQNSNSNSMSAFQQQQQPTAIPTRGGGNNPQQQQQKQNNLRAQQPVEQSSVLLQNPYHSVQTSAGQGNYNTVTLDYEEKLKDPRDRSRGVDLLDEPRVSRDYRSASSRKRSRSRSRSRSKDRRDQRRREKSPVRRRRITPSPPPRPHRRSPEPVRRKERSRDSRERDEEPARRRAHRERSKERNDKPRSDLSRQSPTSSTHSSSRKISPSLLDKRPPRNYRKRSKSRSPTPKRVRHHQEQPSSRESTSRPRYSIEVPKLALTTTTYSIMDLKTNYPTIQIPSDFFQLKSCWKQSNLKPTDLIESAVPIQIFRKHVDKIDIGKLVSDDSGTGEQKIMKLDDTGFNTEGNSSLFTVKLILLAFPTKEKLYEKCVGINNSNNGKGNNKEVGGGNGKSNKEVGGGNGKSNNKEVGGGGGGGEEDGKVILQHLSRVINFIFGVKGSGKNEPLTIGGQWNESLDGSNPHINPTVLINTGVRTFKLHTGLDLSSCKNWYRFMEIYYKRENGLMESVVYFIPDLTSCLPNSKDWEITQKAYKWLFHGEDEVLKEKSKPAAVSAAAEKSTSSSSVNANLVNKSIVDNSSSSSASGEKKLVTKETTKESNSTNGANCEGESTPGVNQTTMESTAAAGGLNQTTMESTASATEGGLNQTTLQEETGMLDAANAKKDDLPLEKNAEEMLKESKIIQDSKDESMEIDNNGEDSLIVETLSLAEVKQMNVAKLKEELTKRRLSTKGLKAQLLERLSKALIEAQQQSATQVVADIKAVSDDEKIVEQQQVEPNTGIQVQQNVEQETEETKSAVNDEIPTISIVPISSIIGADDEEKQEQGQSTAEQENTEKVTTSEVQGQEQPIETTANTSTIAMEIDDPNHPNEETSSEQPSPASPPPQLIIKTPILIPLLTTEMDDRTKRIWERRYTLPQTPHLLIYPTTLLEDFDCFQKSLSAIREILADSNKKNNTQSNNEVVFELSIFIELFHEMLQFGFGLEIFKEIVARNEFKLKLRKEKDDEKVKRKEEEKEKEKLKQKFAGEEAAAAAGGEAAAAAAAGGEAATAAGEGKAAGEAAAAAGEGKAAGEVAAAVVKIVEQDAGQVGDGDQLKIGEEKQQLESKQNGEKIQDKVLQEDDENNTKVQVIDKKKKNGEKMVQQIQQPINTEEENQSKNSKKNDEKSAQEENQSKNSKKNDEKSAQEENQSTKEFANTKKLNEKKKRLQLAFSYFDPNNCGQISIGDLESLILALGIGLNCYQIRKLLRSVTSKSSSSSNINYEQWIQESSIFDEQFDKSDQDMEKLIKGNRSNLPIFIYNNDESKNHNEDNDLTTNTDLSSEQLKIQLNKYKKSAMDNLTMLNVTENSLSEAKNELITLRKSNVDLKDELNKTKESLKKLESEYKVNEEDLDLFKRAAERFYDRIHHLVKIPSSTTSSSTNEKKN